MLRPNVRAQVERDSALLLLFAKLLALHPVLRLSDPVGFTREFAAELRRQTNLSLEAEVMDTPDDTLEQLKRYHVYRDGVDWEAVRRSLEAFAKKYSAEAERAKASLSANTG